MNDTICDKPHLILKLIIAPFLFLYFSTCGAKEKGHPLMTIIYIGGHVMLYVGNKLIDNNRAAAITYQNVWGMSPESRDKRYVIGQSLFFPLLKYYPENPEVSSLAATSHFKLVYLDELNAKADSPHGFANKFLERKNL